MQVILDQTKILDLRGVLGQQVLPTCRIIYRCASGSHCDIPSPGRRRKGQQDTAGAMWLIGIMVALRFARTQGSYCTDIAKKNARTCINTNARAQGILRDSRLRKSIFHVPEILPGHFA